MSWQNNPPNTVGNFTTSNSWSGFPESDYIDGLMSGGVWGNNDPNNGQEKDLLYIFQEDDLLAIVQNTIAADLTFI